jgi:stage III sporulation protein AF
MTDFIRQWVINIVALVLFIVIIEMLLPKGKMKKYASIATGTIMIITIISPLLELSGKDFSFVGAQAAGNNMISRIEIENNSRLMEQEQMEQIIEVYRADIIEQIEHNAQEVEGVRDVKADIIINEDAQSEDFGMIRRAYLSITLEEGDSSPEEGDGSPGTTRIKAIKVGQVGDVGGVSGIKRSQTDERDCPMMLKRKLQERIGTVFGISSENIIITKNAR